MNLKLLIPSYRNRHLFIKSRLEQYSSGKWNKALNLGCGEGDYDPMIANYARQTIGCDINENDIAFAKKTNAETSNLSYLVEDALALSFEDNSFDLITSMEVIEHVGKPYKMMKEIKRVLRPGGLLLMTYPSLDFPFTYDPINRILSFFGNKHISQGAFAFGHDYLISPKEFRRKVKEMGFEILEENNSSGYLIGLLEMYWTGWIQKLFKANSANLNEKEANKITIRPDQKAPGLVIITDLIIWIDKFLFSKLPNSVGKAVVLRKK